MRLLNIIIYFSIIIFPCIASGRSIEISSNQKVGILDVYAEREKFTDNYCDSLHQMWWNIIRRSRTPESFSEQFTCDESFQSDSTLYLDPQMQRWILFLICYSDTYCCQGIGSTIDLNIKTISSNPDIPTVTPLNYTQCIAALTWYDINREYVDPILFFHFSGNLGFLKKDATQDWFNYIKNPIYFLSDLKEISNLNSETLSQDYRDLAKIRAMELFSSIEEKQKKCLEKAISILPYFHIWQLREYTREVATYQGRKLISVYTEF